MDTKQKKVLKVGDVVEIKPLEWFNKYKCYDDSVIIWSNDSYIRFSKNMSRYCGKTMSIKCVVYTKKMVGYKLGVESEYDEDIIWFKDFFLNNEEYVNPSLPVTKYTVGDKVKVCYTNRPNIFLNKDTMAKFGGQKVEISAVLDYGVGITRYTIKEDDKCAEWHERCFQYKIQENAFEDEDICRSESGPADEAPVNSHDEISDEELIEMLRDRGFKGRLEKTVVKYFDV